MSIFITTMTNISKKKYEYLKKLCRKRSLNYVKMQKYIYPELMGQWYKIINYRHSPYSQKQINLAMKLILDLENHGSFNVIEDMNRTLFNRYTFNKAMEIVTVFSKNGTNFNRHVYGTCPEKENYLQEIEKNNKIYARNKELIRKISEKNL